MPSPTVETLTPTGLTANGATLNGTVDPNGLPTSYHFAYTKADPPQFEATQLLAIYTWHLTADDTYVYCGSYGNAIGRAKLDGSNQESEWIPLAYATGEPRLAVAVNDTHIYWVAYDGYIGRANIDGTGKEEKWVALSGKAPPQAAAIDDEYLYWTLENNKLGRVKLDGTGLSEEWIVPGTNEASGLAVNDTHIYWSSNANTWIGRAKIDGTGKETPFISPPFEYPGNWTGGIYLTDTHIYFGCRGAAAESSSLLCRTLLDGTDFKVVAPMGYSYGFQAADDDYLYQPFASGGTYRLNSFRHLAPAALDGDAGEADQPRINYFTNPSVEDEPGSEFSTTDSYLNAGATRVRSEIFAHSGDGSLLVETAGVTFSEGVDCNAAFEAAKDDWVVISVWARSQSGEEAIEVTGYLGAAEDGIGGVPVTLTTEWQRISIAIKATAKRTSGRIVLRNTAPGQVRRFYVDDILCEVLPTEAVGDYFPTPAQLESGEATENEDGTWALGAATPVSETVTDLEDAVGYWYRLYAENEDGLGFGSDEEIQADRVSPDTFITSSPDVKSVGAGSPTFEFESDEEGATFEVRVDGGTWEPAISPHTLDSISPGPHLFEVRAKDEAGNVDPTPASFEWTFYVGKAKIEFVPSGGEPTIIEPQTGGTGIFLPRGEVGDFFPTTQLEDEWAESSDTEGGRRVRVKVGNADGSGSVIVSGDSRDEFKDFYTSWEMLVSDMDDFGGELRYTPPEGETITYVIESMKITSAPYDGTKMRGWVQEYQFSFTCQPYGRLEDEELVLAGHDAFEYDSITNSDWAADAGTGTLSAGTGELVPSSTAIKRYYRSGVEVEDARHVIQVTPKSDVSKGVTGVGKRIDTDNSLFAEISFNGASSKVLIRKRDGGSDSTLAESGTFTATSDTKLWVEFVQEDSLLKARVYKSDPRLAEELPTAAASASHTLSAEDATQFGSGIWGNPSVRLEPASTEYRWFHWSAEATTFRSTKPIQALETPRVPGSADALLDLSLTDLASKDRRHLEVGMEAGGHSYDTNQAPPVLIDSAIMDDANYAGTHESVTGAYGGKAITLTVNERALAMIGIETSHSGPYRPKVRMQHDASEDTVYVRIAHRLHDVGYFSEGDWVVVPPGGWREVDLGVIEIPTAPEGDQGVTLQIEIYSNGEEAPEASLDYLLMQGASRWAKSSVSLTTTTPAQVAALDEFNQTVTGGSDPATGKSAQIGGTYSAMTGSDTDDFEIEDENHTLRRKAKEDAGGGFGPSNKYKGRAIGLNTNMTNTAFALDITFSGDAISNGDGNRVGQILRSSGEDDFLIVYLQPGKVTLPKPGFPYKVYPWKVEVEACVSGSKILETGENYDTSLFTVDTDGIRLLTMVVGEELLVLADVGFTGTYHVVLSTSDPELGPGGKLEKGDVFVYDENPEAVESVRTFDNLLAWEPDRDAVLFSGQTSRFRHSDGIRENVAGTAWSALPDYEGARMRVPCAGGRGLTSRLSAKARRGNVLESNDEAIEDKLEISGTITPRVLLLG